MTENTSHYDTLNIAPDATPGEIRAAYKKLAMRLHPDRNRGKTESTEEFQRVQHAYRTLSDPEARAHYDATGMDKKNRHPRQGRAGPGDPVRQPDQQHRQPGDDRYT